MTRTRFLVLMWATLTLILCFGDHFFHVRTGMLAYAWNPLVDGQSAWVWLIFAVAMAAFLSLSALVPLRDVPPTVPWGPIIDGAVLFVGAYALSGQLGASHPAGLFVALAVSWLARVVARGTAAPTYLVHGLGFAALGVVSEGLFSMMGLFDYDLQQVVDCPWWLAGLYLHGSIALLEINRGARSLAARA
jgi:hypothetical protein